MPVDVFISAGEASGDLQASLLVRALRRRRSGLVVAGVGGERLRAAGADVWLDSIAQEWASMGHLRAYLKIPRMLAIMLGLARRLSADPPRLLVCVDFGAFNLRMLEWLRFCNYRARAIYYFPPGAWIDNASQARKVARVASAVTPLAHQADFYRRLGLAVEYFGHPLASAIASRPPRQVAAPPQIAVLPGSRPEELALHLPTLAQAALSLGPARFTVAAASDARRQQIRNAWPSECGGDDVIVRRDAVDVVSDADVAWVASGTAVMETALAGVPQIAFYRLTDAQYRVALRHVPHIVRGPITLPNLVTGRPIVPELLQHDFSADRLVAMTRELLKDGAARERQLAGYADFRRALGPADALDRIADYLSALLPASAVA